MKYKKIDHPQWRYELTEDVEFTVKRLFDYKGVDEEFYNFKRNGLSTTVTVKEGYRWDGVTAPKKFKGLLDLPKFRKAALIHDVFLQAIYDDKVVDERHLSFAHKVFRKQLTVDTNIFVAYSMYIGLVLGHGIWHKRTS